MEGETGRGWIKLEIPECDNKLVFQQVTKLTAAIEAMGIDVINKQQSDVQRVVEQDCELFYEVNFELMDAPFSERLIYAIRNYLNEINKVRQVKASRAYVFLLKECSLIALLALRAFIDHNRCCVPNVQLSALYFGNIQGGLFINHWEVSFWKEALARENIIRNGTRFEDTGNNMNQILADFEFDKADMITIRFRNREQMDVRNMGIGRQKKQSVTMCYQIIIKRNSIRRIICDPVASDSKGTNHFRIHFDLNCPVFIRRGFLNDQKEQKYADPIYTRRLNIHRGRDEGDYPKEEAISDSPIFTMEFDDCISLKTIYGLLSRLRIRTGASIEFASLPAVDCLIWKVNPYHKWSGSHSPTSNEDIYFREFQKTVLENIEGTAKERMFAITYLIECLLSRGAVVKDQLLLDENTWFNFLALIARQFCRDHKLCEAAFEDLINMLDSRKRIGSILKCFEQICRTRLKNQLVNGLSEEQIREGFQRVRKVIVTPTRKICIPPEMIMGNRVLRKFDKDGTRVLRVTFRDDDNTRMRTSKTSEYIIDQAVLRTLAKGLNVAGRSFGYLGSSNSQMRDCGAYFMEKYTSSQLSEFQEDNPTHGIPYEFIPKIQSARKSLGKFQKIDNIPKMMARLGQCFTQSRMSGVDLDHAKYFTTSDLIGGKNSKGDVYTFSDGVGAISYDFAKQICEVMCLGSGIPSCFQFRFRGMKGVIAIEPLLDEMKRWAEMNEIPAVDEERSWDSNCAFRPSQIKFTAKRSKNEQIEIVKFASPVPVALNKPFINILDQVSEMQSVSCHRRMVNRIEELLDHVMKGYSMSMIDEKKCRNRLKDLPRRINVDFLRISSGFALSNEPFFRSLIKASIKCSILKQERKLQIPISFEKGRSMLGVVDETGQLQYGQIFVQYTKNIALKIPPPTAARVILTGKVLLTKNPCIVSGDVRVFTAVDVPELHHMCDVVVFPQSGPRPHPDEMAGSDLDGDEYSVIWDQELLLDRNEEPFDFAAEKKKQEFKEEDIERLMREFYVNYIKLDSVGTISNSHLHQSDQYGLNSKVCMNLARKNNQAVDFTKSGVAPEALTTKWEEDETGEMIPPEKPERVPDYHIGNEYQPMYISPRLIGSLFREFKSIADVLAVSEERDELVEIAIDEAINVDGYENFMEKAKEKLAKYNAQLRSLMETYGIRTEGEIFSGCIVEMRNRISDKDQDDMSMFSTNDLIEMRVTTLFRDFREEFFQEFGGWLIVTEPFNRMSEESNVLQRVCMAPSQKMMQKAVAYYRACYQEAQQTRENKKLSFAWIAFDVLHQVKMNAVLDMDDFYMSTNPLFSMLEDHRRQFCKDRVDQFNVYRRFDQADSSNKRMRDANQVLQMYATANPGLDRVLFVLAEWAQKTKLFTSSMKSEHLAMLAVMYATGYFGNVESNRPFFFDKIDMDDYDASKVEDVDPMSEMEQTQLMVGFLQYLSSRKFRKQDFISFMPLGVSSVFMRGQWINIHLAALKTFYNMLFNLRFEELPVSTDSQVAVCAMARESEPFVIELPAHADYQLVEKTLKKRTGVEVVRLRALRAFERDENRRVRYLVSTRGTLESVHKLRQLVAVKVPTKTSVSSQQMPTQLATLSYEKILRETAPS